MYLTEKEFLEILNVLTTMTTLTRLKYGNLNADVYKEIEKAEKIISKMKKTRRVK